MVWVSGTLLLMMNGVGIWDIVTYVQKRAVLQTQSIQNVHISFSLNGSHITQWHFCMRLAPSHIKYSSVVNLMVVVTSVTRGVVL